MANQISSPCSVQERSALFTDFYELTMSQGDWLKNKNRRAVFEMFFRRNPFKGGFSVFAGLETLLDCVKTFRFSDDDIQYLHSLKFFNEGFLDYLKDFKFTGSIYAMDEGSVVFPHEPLLRIDSTLIECQILEGLVLNTINFQSLIATKTARVKLAAGEGGIMEFGLRRAQGQDGALSASRASFIGGADGTSNTLAGKQFGIKVMGTMAHAWIMSFANEEDAFRTYAEVFPNNPVFLIDTYDTLKSGVLNAIKVGKEVIAHGGNFGVRLDSGDMYYLSKKVREMLDEAGCRNATITVSNDLDERIISTLTSQGAPINSWGVGTQMVTGGSDSAFTGVYKMMCLEDGNGNLKPTIKFSDNPEKTTTPAIKQIWRIYDKTGMTQADILAIDDPDNSDNSEKLDCCKKECFWHPSADYRHFYQTLDTAPQPLLKKCMEGGKQISQNPSLSEVQDFCKKELQTFDASYKRLLNPHIFKVAITTKLRTLKLDLIKNFLGDL
ncbi:MAG: nicotinate phosphoribosyltransferase [Termitinemataceae bacterium]|nr:MAG: nicotinate phosphoribosyltransferase [Termitinemataceae bacterium]